MSRTSTLRGDGSKARQHGVPENSQDGAPVAHGDKLLMLIAHLCHLPPSLVHFLTPSLVCLGLLPK